MPEIINRQSMSLTHTLGSGSLAERKFNFAFVPDEVIIRFTHHDHPNGNIPILVRSNIIDNNYEGYMCIANSIPTCPQSTYKFNKNCITSTIQFEFFDINIGILDRIDPLNHMNTTTIIVLELIQYRKDEPYQKLKPIL